MQRSILAAVVVISAWFAAPAMGQIPSPVPQPQLSPYLYLTRGGEQGYLDYRQALDQTRQAAAPYTPPPSNTQYNRTTNYQANPQTTGIAPNTATGHADTRGAVYAFQNYSHFYTIRPNAARPY